jgi:hypothetical protein
MCRQCHETISEEGAVTDLQDAIAKPQFEHWNTTSVAHSFQFALGTHGPQARVLSLETLRSFSDWYEKNRRDGYMPSMGLQPMYRLSELKRTITWLETYDPPEDTCLDERYADLSDNMPSDGATSPASFCVLF